MQLNIGLCDYSVTHIVGQDLWNILKSNTRLLKWAGNLQIKNFCVFRMHVKSRILLIRHAFFFQ